jgi:hypothetical protein
MNWSVTRQRSCHGVKEEGKKGRNYFIVCILIFSFAGHLSFAQQEIPLAKIPEVPLPVMTPVSVSPLYTEEAVAAGEQAEKEANPTSTLQGTIIEKGTGATLQDVAVEVLTLGQDGEVQRAYTTLLHHSEFNLPLYPESTHLLILRKAGYEPEAFLIDKEQAMHKQTFALAPKKEVSNQEDQRTKGTVQYPPILTGIEMGDFLDLSEIRTESSRLLALIASQSLTEHIQIKEEYLETEAMDFVAKEAPSQPEEASIGRFVLTASTSFRQKATHKSDVLLRFRPNDEVEVLEKTNKWWWRVRYDERTGYVKAQLLEPAD